MSIPTSVAGENQKGRGNGPVIFVESQQLYFDSIVLADLPPKGRFQQLIPGENGLSTEFGPGDVGHLGGRWWLDLNDNGVMDGADKYFLCPLLGPGRITP
ncbi:hypothetical protein [Thalassomonas actiniarum]|nr:hypothetical protein [Thalassomonas actiniarum]